MARYTIPTNRNTGHICQQCSNGTHLRCPRRSALRRHCTIQSMTSPTTIPSRMPAHTANKGLSHNSWPAPMPMAAEEVAQSRADSPASGTNRDNGKDVAPAVMFTATRATGMNRPVRTIVLPRSANALWVLLSAVCPRNLRGMAHF